MNFKKVFSSPECVVSLAVMVCWAYVGIAGYGRTITDAHCHENVLRMLADSPDAYRKWFGLKEADNLTSHQFYGVSESTFGRCMVFYSDPTACMGGRLHEGGCQKRSHELTAAADDVPWYWRLFDPPIRWHGHKPLRMVYKIGK